MAKAKKRRGKNPDSRLMKNMEKEGMLIKNSSILGSPQEAQEVGKRLHVK